MNRHGDNLIPTPRWHTVVWDVSAQRLLFFLVCSLSLHCLLIVTFPDLRRGSRMEAPSPSLQVYLTPSTVAAMKPMIRSPASAVARTRDPSPITRKARKTPAHTRVAYRHASRHNGGHITDSDVGRASLPDIRRTPARSTATSTTDTSPVSTAYTAWLTPSPTQARTHLRIFTGQSHARHAPNPPAVAMLLRHALLQHFHYPAIARQNNWEGKVILDVRVAADGTVGATRILRASGFHVLDRAAQHAANDIGELPAARPFLAGHSLSFRVPVAYRLQR